MAFACTSCRSLSTLGRWDSEWTPFYSATGGTGHGGADPVSSGATSQRLCQVEVDSVAAASVVVVLKGQDLLAAELVISGADARA